MVFCACRRRRRKANVAAEAAGFRERRNLPHTISARVCVSSNNNIPNVILDARISKTVGCCREAQHWLSCVCAAVWVACHVQRENLGGSQGLSYRNMP